MKKEHHENLLDLMRMMEKSAEKRVKDYPEKYIQALENQINELKKYQEYMDKEDVGPEQATEWLINSMENMIRNFNFCQLTRNLAEYKSTKSFIKGMEEVLKEE